MVLVRFLLSFRGRVNRAKFWLMLLTTIFYASAVQDFRFREFVAPAGKLIEWGLPLSILFLLYATVAVAAKRLHDLNYSAWWLIVCAAMPVGLAVAASYVSDDPSVLNEPQTLTMARGAAGWLMMGCLLAYWADLVILGGVRGTRGANRFGPDPLAPSLTQ